MTLNDAILAATGGPTLNDGLRAFYALNGAPDGPLSDMERAYLIGQIGSGQELGPELLVDSSFDTGIGWTITSGLDISGGALRCPGQTSQLQVAEQFAVAPSGSRYLLAIDVEEVVVGSIVVVIQQVGLPPITSPGTYHVVSPGYGAGDVGIVFAPQSVGIVNSMSVKQELKPPDTTNDLWMRFLAGLGYQGTVNDRQLQFWQANITP